MQRLFTMFPGGAPGLALVLLRLSVMGWLWQPLSSVGSDSSLPRLLSLGTVSVLLLFGFATPVAGGIACVLGIVFSTDTFAAILHVTTALSLALIGPGAFSIDARLFGRRILTPP